jgi:membrane dipeptidase
VHEVATPAVHRHALELPCVARSPAQLTDDQIRALASRGGVVGINFYGELCPTRRRWPVVEHIVHALEVGGEDHVALGPDYVWDYFQTTDAKGMADGEFTTHAAGAASAG